MLSDRGHAHGVCLRFESQRKVLFYARKTLMKALTNSQSFYALFLFCLERKELHCGMNCLSYPIETFCSLNAVSL